MVGPEGTLNITEQAEEQSELGVGSDPGTQHFLASGELDMGMKAALGESSDGGQHCTNSSCVMFASDEAQREDSSGLSGKNTYRRNKMAAAEPEAQRSRLVLLPSRLIVNHV